MNHPEQKFLPFPEGELSYLEWDFAGPEAPIIHFAHANGFNARTYERLLSLLSERFHVYAWDARGHGRSTLPARSEMLQDNWDLYQEDLRRFLEHIGKPMFLLGHSLGAVVSMELTSRWTRFTRGLMLLDPVILPPRFLSVIYLMKRLGIESRFPIAAKAVKRTRVWPDLETLRSVYQGRGGFRSWACSACFDGYLEGGTRRRNDGYIELSCDPAWEARTFSTLSHLTWWRLQNIYVPLTVLYGRDSDTFQAGSARLLPRIVPHARLISVPDSGHFVPMEQPERVLEEIGKFTAEVLERAASRQFGSRS